MSREHLDRLDRALAAAPGEGAPPAPLVRAVIPHPTTGELVPASLHRDGSLVHADHPKARKPAYEPLGDPRHERVDRQIETLGEAMLMAVQAMERDGVADFPGLAAAVRAAHDAAAPPPPAGDHPFRDAAQHERWHRARAAVAAFRAFVGGGAP